MQKHALHKNHATSALNLHNVYKSMLTAPSWQIGKYSKVVCNALFLVNKLAFLNSLFQLLFPEQQELHLSSKTES